MRATSEVWTFPEGWGWGAESAAGERVMDNVLGGGGGEEA